MGIPAASAGPTPDADAPDDGDLGTRVGVVLPIRSFEGAKARLAPRLTETARATFARELADHVMGAAGSLRVVVVTSAPEVQTWARDSGADVLDDPGPGLDTAAAAGCDHLARLGFERAIVAHADLPDAGPLASIVTDLDARAVVLVPCHRDDGTNVCSIPLPRTFEFAYGPDSFRRHVGVAERLDLPVVVLRRADLAFDVDVPADYDRLLARSET